MIAAAAIVHACSAEVLEVRLGPSDGAAGTISYRLIFTNTGRLRCTLRGYPGVSSVDASGATIGASAERVPPRPTTAVVLAPRGSAIAVFGQAQTRNFPAATCRPRRARGLRIYPPNETRSRLLALDHLACSRSVRGSSTIRRVS